MLVDQYALRIQKFTDLSLVQLKTVKGIEEGGRLIAEEEKILRKQLDSKKTYRILLDENGKNFSSRQFATWLDHKRSHVRLDLSFIIGGAFGFSENFKKDADELISLSPLTFSHQLVRIILLEQLYRAYTILANQSYHND